MRTLTKQEIERQDFVDNKVFELVNELLPESKQIDWDIEVIAGIRDAVRVQVVDEKKILSEQKFYSYIKI